MALRVRAKIASLTDPSLRLAFAIEKNNVGAIERELRNGADPNLQTLGGATMLMAAIANGHREAAKALLEGGADPNRISQLGSTVMDLATDASDSDMVVMLLDYGALPSEKLLGRRAQAPDSGDGPDAATEEPMVVANPVRDEDPNLEWEAEREEYETLLKRQNEKLEKLERARADQPAAGGSAANLKKLLDERADEFQKEQAERKRLEAELAEQRDLIDESVNERTAELGREVEEKQTEVDKHKRLSGEMAAQCDDLKSQVEAGAAQFETITAERDKLQVSIEEVTEEHEKEIGAREGVEARFAEAVESAKMAAEAHAGALKSETEAHATALEGEKEAHAGVLKRETEKRARVENELSEARDQFSTQSEQLEEQTTVRQRLEEDHSALTDKLTAMETQRDVALRADAAAREAAEQKLSETKVALEAAIQSKAQFLVAMGRQIENHLNAGAEGAVEADAEDQGDESKLKRVVGSVQSGGDMRRENSPMRSAQP